MIGNVKVLLLENPATELDYITTNELFSVLNELADQGIAIIILTNNIEKYRYLCNRCIMPGGSGERESIQDNPN